MDFSRHFTSRCQDAALVVQPYRYFVASSVLTAELNADLLQWFHETDQWCSQGDGATARATISLQAGKLPQSLAELVDPLGLDEIRKMMEERFEVELKARVEISALRLLPGYQIGPHTDFGSRGQTHRIVISVDPDWSENLGGDLSVLTRSREQNSYREEAVLPPYSGRAFAFEISKRSFHSVGLVKERARHSLCLYFFGGESDMA